MTTDKAKIDEDITGPECDSEHLVRDYNRGELVSKACGLVLDDNFIDQGPEWRAFDTEQSEKRSRSGAPMTVMIHDKGLSTEIGWGNKDIYGKSVPSKNRAQLYRMRKWHNRTKISNSNQRTLAMALDELNRLSSKIGLHRNVRETAASIHRRAVNSNLIRGRSVEAVAAATLYAACRQCNIPWTLDEVTRASRVSKKDQPSLSLSLPGDEVTTGADLGHSLSVALLLGPEPGWRDRGQGHRDHQGSTFQGADLRQRTHGCCRRRHLSSKCAL